jgi:6-phosphogluconolactonase
MIVTKLRPSSGAALVGLALVLLAAPPALAGERMAARHELKVHDSVEQTAAALARRLLTTGQRVVQSQGRFNIALSGGSAAKVYRQVVEQAGHLRGWQVYWVDDRHVPHHAERSNVKAVRDTGLLERVDAHFPMAYSGDPARDARAYEKVIQPVRMHLVVQGIGPDGHTAGLFPSTPGLQREKRLVIPTQRPERFGGGFGISQTIHALNRAEQAVVFAVGAGKREILPKILDPEPGTAPVPAALLRPKSGVVHWYLDAVAAP